MPKNGLDEEVEEEGREVKEKCKTMNKKKKEKTRLKKKISEYSPLMGYTYQDQDYSNFACNSKCFFSYHVSE